MATVTQCDNCKVLKSSFGPSRYKWVKYSNWIYTDEFCSNKCLIEFIKKHREDKD